MSSYSSLILAHANLKAYYRLGEASGGTLTDSKGTNNGTINGGGGSGVTYGVTGAIANDSDTAMTFAGTGVGAQDPIRVADDNALDLGDGPLSIELWFKRSATQGTLQILVSKNANAYELRFATTNRLNFAKNGVASVLGSSAITDTASWHHVVATKNGSSRNIYVDGVLDNAVVSTDQTFADNTNALDIGHANGASRYVGSLDEVALYNAVLTADEVLQHYRTGIAQVGLTDSVTLSESTSKEPGPVVAETLTTSDAQAKDITTTRTDAVTPADATAAAPETTRTDSVTTTDAVSSEPGLIKADSVTLSDDEVAEAGLGLSDTATLSDALTTADEIVLGDTVTLSDDVAPDLVQALTLDLDDTVTLADDFSAVSQPDVTATAGGRIAVRQRKAQAHALRLQDFVLVTDGVTSESHQDLAMQREEELVLALV